MPNLRARTLHLAARCLELRPALAWALGADGGVSLGERAVLAAAGDPDLLRRVEAIAQEVAGNTQVIQQPPIVIQQPPIIVQQDAGAPAVAPTQVPQPDPGPSLVGALFVTERTQKGFEADFLPEMERLLSSGMSREDVASHIRGLISQAFSAKNHLYNILIQHQATFEGDGEYRESLERLVQAWVADTATHGE